MDDQRRAVEVAQSLDASVALVPFLAELLADVFAIGCSADRVVDLVRSVGLAAGSQALDLACGKGALALPLATELGLNVHGVDLFEPFIVEARSRAEAAAIADRCTFELGDLRDALDQKRDVDLAVYAAVGALGPADRCVAGLRQAVRPGGFIVIDDGYLKAESSDRRGYEHYAGRDETLRRLRSHGDTIVEEALVPADEAKSINSRMTELIRQRARRLAAKHPEHRDLLLDYVGVQEDESDFLQNDYVGAVWLLERAA